MVWDPEMMWKRQGGRLPVSKEIASFHRCFQNALEAMLSSSPSLSVLLRNLLFIVKAKKKARRLAMIRAILFMIPPLKLFRTSKYKNKAQ